jgi:hypothetical protein
VAEGLLEGLEDDLRVNRHNGESENAPETAKRGSTKEFEEPIAADVIADNVLTHVSTGREIVDGATILKSQSAWHAPCCNAFDVEWQKTNQELVMTPWMRRVLRKLTDWSIRS